jgi:hypothetical protein
MLQILTFEAIMVHHCKSILALLAGLLPADFRISQLRFAWVSPGYVGGGGRPPPFFERREQIAIENRAKEMYARGEETYASEAQGRKGV